MLAKLAESGDEELGDALAALLEDSSQIDAAKYWGAVGMRELFKNAEKVIAAGSKLRIAKSR